MATQKEEVKEARRSRLNWLIVVGLVTVVTFLCIPTAEYYELSRLKPGQPSPVTYRADQVYRVVDWEKTRRKRNQARARIRPEFKAPDNVRRRIIEAIERDIQALREGSNAPEGVQLPRDPRSWDRVRGISLDVADFFLDQGIIRDKGVFEGFDAQKRGFLEMHLGGSGRDDRVLRREVSLEALRRRLVGLDQVQSRVQQMVQQLYPGFPHRNLVAQLVVDNLQPTVFFDKKEFRNQLQSVDERVEPFYTTYREGEYLVRAGQKVTRGHLEVLQQINDQKIRFQFSNGLASLGIVLISLGFVYVYLRDFDPRLFEQHNKLALMAVLVIVFVALAKGVKLLTAGLPPSVEYALPLAAPVMLVTLMVTEELAFLMTLFLSVLTVSLFGFSFDLFVMYLFGGLAGIFCIRRVERRVTLLQSGVLIGAVNVLTVAFFYALQTGSILQSELGPYLIWSGLNGVLITPFVTLGLLPFLENGFGITTNFRLLELADLNHPLLRKLFQEAPGTFQHSIMLSNLCEQAARAIGANALLVRVGGYYHDLGKAETPEYFIENQGDQQNPHDQLKPTLSASILKAHVKKGSEMAREAGLPREIIDLIEQHHGTTLMKPFYHEALTEGDGEVSREEFQYPGPLPQTREAGICMLGDAVEAATRALDNPNPGNIRERTTEIVHQKFSEGQLNECALTLKDLDIIIDTFTRVLTSVHHRRIEYPDEPGADGQQSLPGDLEPPEVESLMDPEES